MSTLTWIRHEDLAIKKKPTVGRQEYLDHLTFRANERPLFTELFGPIVGLKEEWRDQGATTAELDFSAFRYRCQATSSVAVNTGRIIRRPARIVEETDEHLITVDDIGRRLKLPKGKATLPLPMNYPVRNMDDWLKIKPLYEFDERRFEEHWKERATRDRLDDKVISVDIPGGFDEPRELLGDERLCCAYYDDPELVHDIIDTICDTAYRVLDRVSLQIKIDELSVHEDMAGKSGPLVGPKQVKEFIAPYYRKIWDMLAERGARIFDQDSDGNMNPVIDSFLDAGVNVMHPMETAAGMDIVKVRQQYGNRLAFVGGIDKHVIRRSFAEIESEIVYKVTPMLGTGGCVLSLDHRIPNGTPLNNYKFYLQRMWELLDSRTT